jgi:hypothetical protein
MLAPYARIPVFYEQQYAMMAVPPAPEPREKKVLKITDKDGGNPRLGGNSSDVTRNSSDGK